MSNQFLQKFFATIFGTLLVFFGLAMNACGNAQQNANTPPPKVEVVQKTTPSVNTPSNTKVLTPNTQNTTNQSNTGIDQKVYTVLKYIKANGKAPDGYVGGRQFQNRERRLPQRDTKNKPITYQEWDVNPKVRNVNRGAERLVTGSDGKAYYTDDHYRTFKEINY